MPTKFRHDQLFHISQTNVRTSLKNLLRVFGIRFGYRIFRCMVKTKVFPEVKNNGYPWPKFTLAFPLQIFCHALYHSYRQKSIRTLICTS